MGWNELQVNWRIAMQAAISAYLEDSIPIGAVVIDAHGGLVSTGQNRFKSGRLAHAETQALNDVPLDADRKHLSLYTTMEPCPMCTGAIRVMQLQSLHVAAWDPAAGSTELFKATQFMRQFECDITGPDSPELEFVNVALMLEYRTRNNHLRWREKWYSYLPAAVDLGEQLANQKRFDVWQRDGVPGEVIFEEVLSYLR